MEEAAHSHARLCFWPGESKGIPYPPRSQQVSDGSPGPCGSARVAATAPDNSCHSSAPTSVSGPSAGGTGGA